MTTKKRRRITPISVMREDTVRRIVEKIMGTHNGSPKLSVLDEIAQEKGTRTTRVTNPAHYRIVASGKPLYVTRFDTYEAAFVAAERFVGMGTVYIVRVEGKVGRAGPVEHIRYS